MAGAFTIAIVGAESTGKTTLARTLACSLASTLSLRLAQEDSGSSIRVAWVPELLREWCDRAGRTPLRHEQHSIAQGQHERIRAAAALHDIVVCDTTALMTAVYSDIVFGDHALDESAAALHRELSLTLLTAIDLPWVSDGHQRDGPHVRAPVDNALRALMQAQGIVFSVISGAGALRADNALAAVHAALRGRDAGAATSLRRGLFSGLGAGADEADAQGASQAPASSRRWVCDCCVPEAERALRALKV